MKYKFDKDRGIIDENDNQIMQLLKGVWGAEYERIYFGKTLEKTLNNQCRECKQEKSKWAE